MAFTRPFLSPVARDGFQKQSEGGQNLMSFQLPQYSDLSSRSILVRIRHLAYLRSQCTSILLLLALEFRQLVSLGSNYVYATDTEVAFLLHKTFMPQQTYSGSLPYSRPTMFCMKVLSLFNEYLPVICYIIHLQFNGSSAY
jgi:hypothetical protein